MTLSLGLDISSTSTGALILEAGSDAPVAVGLWTPPTTLDYIDRGSWQAEKMLVMLEKFTPDKICIEDYAFSTSAEAVITVGTVLRYFLRQTGHVWLTPSVSQLKKYAHAQTKEDIKVAVYKRWGYEHKSNDVMDAYVLAQMGLGLLGVEPCVPLTVPQKEVLHVMTNPKVKPSRKKARA